MLKVDLVDRAEQAGGGGGGMVDIAHTTNHMRWLAALMALAD
jgi:hypothetical protein